MIRWEDAPGPYEVVFSTREGGVSEGPYASLNLGRATADEPKRVNENRRRLCAEVGAEPDALAMNYQHHSADVLRAQAGSRGARGDGIWTDERGAARCSSSPPTAYRSHSRARTVPSLRWRCCTRAGVVCWRGSCPPGVSALGGGAVSAAVGPAIGPCCYEVGEDVADRFRRAFGFGLYRDGRLDLWTAAERALRAAGCVRVDRVDLCTACSPERFFSHRRDEGLTGRQGVIGHIG